MRTDELEQRLGERLRALRIQRDLTQAELAEAANVSLGALKRLERDFPLVPVARADSPW